MAAPAKPRGPLGLLLAAAKPEGLAWDLVARRAGTAKTTVEGWLPQDGREPKLRQVLAVAAVLEIPPDDLAVAAMAVTEEDPALAAAIEAARARAEDLGVRLRRELRRVERTGT